MSSITENKKVLAAVVILVLVLTTGGMYYWTQILQKSHPSEQCNIGAVTINWEAGKGEFTLPIFDRNGLTNQTLTLSDFKCRVVVLEFMAPWCPPCWQAVPAIESLHNQYADKGVVFIAVAVPWPPTAHYEDVTLTQFLNKYNSSLTYVYDSTGQVTKTYGVQEVPTLFVLSKNGSVNATYAGADPIASNSVAKAIDQALG